MIKKETVTVEMDIDIYDIFRFCRIRETIRKNKENNNPDWYAGLDSFDVSKPEMDILQNSRMNNIFRDHDRVSKKLFSKVEGLDGRDLWRNLLIGRYMNREDRIEEVFPLMSDDWYESTGWNEETPLFNTQAYQIHPHACKKIFGVETTREIIPLIHTKITPTYEAVINSKSIKEASEAANQAFGKYTLFPLFQSVLDLATLKPHLIDPKSECIVGQGAHATFEALNMGLDDIASQARQLWPEHLEVRPDGLYEFDVENIMCEFRKFMQRQRDGITTNRRYIAKQQKCDNNVTLDAFFG